MFGDRNCAWILSRATRDPHAPPPWNDAHVVPRGRRRYHKIDATKDPIERVNLSRETVGHIEITLDLKSCETFVYDRDVNPAKSSFDTQFFENHMLQRRRTLPMGLGKAREQGFPQFALANARVLERKDEVLDRWCFVWQNVRSVR